MKKLFTLFAAMLSVSMLSFGQYYFNTYNPAGMNPGGLNTDPEQPFGATGVTAAAGYTSVIANGTTALQWSATQTIPFAFSFNGSPVTSYKVSNSGVLTFTTAATTVPSFTNATIPNNSIPDNSVMIWGLQQSVGSSNDGIIKKTHGTAPNRQHWINFASFSAPGATGSQWTYWGIVLEETTNNIYIVDLRTYLTPLTLTIGIQIDSATAYSIAGAPTTPSFVTNGGSVSDPSDNVYYEFIQGTRPNDDIELTEVNVDELILSNSTVTIGGVITNGGADTLTSFDLNWTADGGTTVNSQTINATVLPQATYNFTHSTTWTPARGDYTLEVYSSNPNGNADQRPINDTLATQIEVRNFVSRNVLLEEFTTAPCQFCPDGAVVVEQILATNPAVIGVGEHACFGTDAMTIPEASTYCSAFGSGAPTACIDRVLFPGETNVAHGRGSWAANADDRSDIGAFVDMTLTGTYNTTTRQVSANIGATIVDSIPLPAGSDFRVTLFVVEDSVTGTGTGYNQVNFYNTQFGHPYYQAGNPIIGFVHRHVLRDVYPTNNAWGEAGIIPNTPVINNAYTKNHTFTLSNAWDKDQVSLVAFVSYYNAVASQRQVLNAIEVKLNNIVTSVSEVKRDISSLSIYPNPSNDVTTIEMNLSKSQSVQVAVLDMTGKEVMFENFGVLPQGQQMMKLNVANLPSGFYLVNMRVGEEFVTKKISVISE